MKIFLLIITPLLSDLVEASANVECYYMQHIFLSRSSKIFRHNMLNYFYHFERVISNVGVVVGHFDSPLFTQPDN